MGTILDYVKWYGRFDFEKLPFNEVDAVIFSELSYLDLKPLQNDGVTLTVSNVVKKLKQNGQLKVRTVDGGENAIPLVTTIAETTRYGDVMISSFEDLLEEDAMLQFSACDFRVANDLHMIAFRGTDETTIGWKEDFMITYTKTAAQDQALAYVKAHCDHRKLIIGGHSKGGNLALYAASQLSEEEQKQLEQVYVLDAPGFCDDVLSLDLISAINSLCTRIIPESSIIGRIYEPKITRTMIVKSSQKGILAHDLLSWQIAYGAFVEVEHVNSESEWVHDAIQNWVETAAIDERQHFVDTLFQAMEDSGIHEVKDLVKDNGARLENVLIKVIGEDPQARKTAFSLPLHAMYGEEVEEVKNNTFLQKIKQSTRIQSLLLMIAGILCVFMPNHFLESSMTVILAIPLIFEIAVTFRHLKQNHWDFKMEKTRLLICIVISFVYAVLCIKNGAMFLVASAAFGSMFLAFAFLNAYRLEHQSTRLEKISVHIESIIAAILGIYILIAPKTTLKWYMTSAGVLMVIMGISLFFEKRRS